MVDCWCRCKYSLPFVALHVADAAVSPPLPPSAAASRVFPRARFHRANTKNQLRWRIARHASRAG
jgi:hypothetical protein